MCVVCGCGDNSATHAGHVHSHVGEVGSERVNPRRGELHFGAGAARVSVPGMSQARTIKLETDILGANNRVAAQNRNHFESHGVTAMNLVSSPGSGKTTLLCATIVALKARSPEVAVSVIEGDQQTSFDADRIRATGAPAVQINTGKGCHLDAPMVAEAFAQLHNHDHDHGHGHGQGNGGSSLPGHVQHDHHHRHEGEKALLFIENVGNLVCPAVWDLGEAAKVVILSTTEGEDKPLKYPDMFAAASLMVLNKIDLLPYVAFDVARCIELARRVNPSIEVLQLSATTGEGMHAWLHWLDHAMGQRNHHHPAGSSAASEAALRAKVAQLEAELVRAKAALSGGTAL